MKGTIHSLVAHVAVPGALDGAVSASVINRASGADIVFGAALASDGAGNVATRTRPTGITGGARAVTSQTR